MEKGPRQCVFRTHSAYRQYPKDFGLEAQGREEIEWGGRSHMFLPESLNVDFLLLLEVTTSRKWAPRDVRQREPLLSMDRN